MNPTQHLDHGVEQDNLGRDADDESSLGTGVKWLALGFFAGLVLFGGAVLYYIAHH